MNPIVLTPAALLLLCVGALAAPVPDPSSARDLKRATAYLETGRTQLSKLPALDSNAGKLHVLDRALYFLRKARALASQSEGAKFAGLRTDAEMELVRALNGKAEIYYDRTSLPQAKRSNLEALALDPHDARALELAAIIQCDGRQPEYVGTAAGRRIGQRIRDRRAAIGVPLRDRGAGIRR